MSTQKKRLNYLYSKARSAASHLGIFKHHIMVKYDNYYSIYIIIPGKKEPERLFINMSFIECVKFFDALIIATKVVKQVKKENTDFINRHFEVINN
tara:strand:+ start:1568 stop:1855 length:288 start_codon:yes stop_codon:yes gene_type:complete